jgi:hypothetical protein
VRPDDVLVDATASAFEDLAVLVDEKVVADVVPPVGEYVIALNAAHDGGGLGRAVRIRPRGVMNDREANALGVERRRADDRLVGAPLRAREDGRPAGSGDDAGLIVDRAPQEEGAETRRVALDPVLDRVRRTRPIGVPELPAGPAARLAAAGIGTVLGLRTRGLPHAPGSIE